MTSIHSTTSTSSSPLQLGPEVLKRLHHLQQADRPISVDEILQAANLNHLALPVLQPTQSKSAETRGTTANHPTTTYGSSLKLPKKLEKSASSLTLAERRRIPVSPKKLKLYAQISSSTPNLTNNTTNTNTQQEKNKDHPHYLSVQNKDQQNRYEKLEEENAKLPPQDSEAYLLSHMERQNALLQADPKSISIEANRLQVDFNTLKQLITDNSTVLPSVGLWSSPDMINHQMVQMTADMDNNKNNNNNNDSLDWDFWQCLVDDYPTAVTKLPHLVAAKLRHGGIPHPLRGVLWQAMAQSSSTRLETLYDHLLETNSGIENDPSSSSSPYARIIQRDLSRTFPMVDMFKSDGGQGQQAMQRILTSYSIYDVQVGYCQGLAFLVGPLLMTMPEKQAFCVFVRLMETYEMRTMFTLNMEGLHLRLHQFQTLLSQLCPRLDAHLSQHSIHPAMYASQWYLTLFAYSLPIHLVMRIYDLVFAEGAVETITRVAIAIMQKNEDILLNIHDFEQLMMYLSSKKLYEVAYQSDAEMVITDAMALSHTITKIKMDNIAETHDQELGQEKSRAHQLLALRFGGWKKNNNSNNNNGMKSPTSATMSKRDSWFPWRETKTSSSSPSNEIPASPTTPTTPLPSLQQHTKDRTVPLLHQQIEDLVMALSQLQKEHSQLNEQVMTLKMDAMDYTTCNEKLTERNTILTKKLKKYKQQLRSSMSGQSTMSSSSSTSFSIPQSPIDLCASPCSVDTSFSTLINKANASRLQVLEQDEEFCHFVESLKLTGDFGSLIASALSTTPSSKQQQDEIQQHPSFDISDDENDNENDDDLSSFKKSNSFSSTTTMNETTSQVQEKEEEKTLDDVTQELVALKLANYEMGQKYELMCHQNETISKQLETYQHKEQMYLDQLAVLEKIRSEQQEEMEIMSKANETLSERMVATKQTCTELHMEKLSLQEQVNALEHHVKALEREKHEYLKPRDSFSEEVFAAHQTLFGEGSVLYKQQQQQSQVQQQQNNKNSNNDYYQKKYVETELRCRELEKLLAESKCKLVEYETMNIPSSTTAKRPTSLIMTNNNIYNNKKGERHSLPMTRDDSTATRASTDSMSTTTSSKRSSVYSRLWNSIASPTTPSSTDGLPPTSFHQKPSDMYQQQPIIIDGDENH
ncbi:rab-GTPase-TBC domain-containing protein [Cunninghamella echinulata]|nr:rab-GTPase-TBC domain-containing protein [Cunninghamella echinulata]